MANTKIIFNRWERLGPYYAMIPFDYVADIIERYTRRGDAVLDPFAGRFSATVAASYSNRVGVGVEINPLGHLYGRVKINPAQKSGSVLRRLRELAKISASYGNKSRDMDEFFHMCYCPKVLRFLLAAREHLNWENGVIDSTLMAHIMSSLHHAKGKGLSNQMRQTKSMAPAYSVKWWKQRRDFRDPPEIDPVVFMEKRLQWRYRETIPADSKSCAYLGDSTVELDNIPPPENKTGKFRLLFTSPPYYNLTNYHKDQWLRLWMLGEPPYPYEKKNAYQKRFANKEIYEQLLISVFSKCAEKLAKTSYVVVRTDGRKYTYKATRRILLKCFPRHKIMTNKISHVKRNQTMLFNRAGLDAGRERDLVLASR